MQFHSRSLEGTRTAARSLAAVIGPDGAVLSLVGDLGVGKTVFVKGLAEGLGIAPDAVASPTFVICSEYPLPGGRSLAHADFYRVEHAAELESAGFLDLLEAGAVIAVEWGDRFPDVLPRDRLEITLRRPDPLVDPAHRLLSALSSGPSAAALLARWSEALTRSGGFA